MTLNKTEEAPKTASPENIVMEVLSKILTDSDGFKRRGSADVPIKHEGDQIILPARPTPMSLEKAIETIADIQEDQETEIAVNEVIRGYHYIDGLVAFNRGMSDVFGWTKAVTVHGFFGSKPPKNIDVQVGPNANDIQRFLMGRFKIPGVEGYIETGFTMDGEIPVLVIQGTVKKKFMPLIETLAETTRQLVSQKSIFRGKAFEIRFDAEGNISTESPGFLDVSVAPMPIFSTLTEQAVVANIFNPIEYSDRCRELKIPLKRGVLLEGPYGTGKTMLSRATANKAVNNGWTFIKLTDAARLPNAVRFARRFMPCVLFLEDVDEAMAGEDRNRKINEVLNTIDGIDGKNDELMVVFTSNHADNINQAMMRPGRLDAIIQITPPDSDAALRLVRLYGRDLIDDKQNYAEVGEALAGTSSAVIREVVERAKLYQIGLEKDGKHKLVLSPESLLLSAQTMKRQLELLAEKVPDETSPAELEHRAIVTETTDSVLASPELKKVLRLIPNMASAMGIK